MSERGKSKNAGKNLVVWLGDDKLAWDAYCKARGLKPSKVLADAARQELKKQTLLGSKPNFEVAGPADDCVARDAGGGRIELRFKQTELAAIDAVSKFYGLSRQEFVTRLTRAWLADSPEFSVHEIELLGEASYQLSSIGRNLNQIARGINENALQYHHSLTLQILEKLVTEIDVCTEVTRKAILACKMRWKIKTGHLKNI